LNHRTPLQGVSVKFALVINEAQNQLGKLFSFPYVEAKHANAELLTCAVKRAAYRTLLLFCLTDWVGAHERAFSSVHHGSQGLLQG